MTTLSAMDWRNFNSVAELEQAALKTILDAAARAIAERGAFHIVLAGGSTPRGVYRLLKNAETNWSAWHIWFGDERCLPPDDAERNSHMAAEVWLDHVPIPRKQIHAIPAELGADAAAAIYADAIREVGEFDLVLLGLGEDGHTASLFPGHDIGADENAPDVIAVHDAPKPPPERVSLSARRLGRAREVIFLVAGESKREAVRQWQEGGAIPAAAIAPATILLSIPSMA
ncbi:MAG: 6-phosphogluconolactonase [Gallionellaceae bacterium]|jgi:6-phosphogluconolactonase|nr:6-phosphogluconolactonase [Gallionellaceae bacterium]